MYTSKRFLLLQALTGSRVLFGLVAAWLIVVGPEGPARWPAVLVLVLLIEISDMLDGSIARRMGVVSDFGRLFDPYADSVSRLTIFLAFAKVGWVSLWLPWLMAVRDISVAYVRITSMAYGVTMAARQSGKLKAWVQGVAAVLLAGAPVFFADAADGRQTLKLLANVAVGTATAWSLFDYARGVLDIRRRAQAAASSSDQKQ